MSAGAARCRHAEACGGCPLQHVAYPEQLQRKRAQVQRLMDEALGPRAPRVRPVLPTPHASGDAPWEFRQKAAFTFGTDGGLGAKEAGVVRRSPHGTGDGLRPATEPVGRLAMGHYSRGGDVVVPIEECPVHPARANRIAFAFRDAFVRAGLRAFGEDGRGLLRHLIVRTSADQREAVAVLVVARHDRRLRAPLRAVMAGPDAPDGLLLNLHDRPGPYLLGRETLHLGGAEQVTETALGETFAVAPTSFFQTNVAAAGELLKLVLAATPAAGPLLDLYSGSGLFALPLARRGFGGGGVPFATEPPRDRRRVHPGAGTRPTARVTAVEENRDAVRDARANLAASGLPESRLRLRAGRVEDVLPGLARERFAAVVLDPPRQGASARVLSLVCETLRPPRVVFVSCNPEALAAELAFAVRAGYRVGEVQPVDMFPHTDHVEAVAYADLDESSASARRSGPAAAVATDAGRSKRRRSSRPQLEALELGWI